MSEQTFNHEAAHRIYTECMARIDAGTYDERTHDGNYGADGIELTIDRLETQAARDGLKFVGAKGSYTLEPMTKQERAEFDAAQQDAPIPVAALDVFPVVEDLDAEEEE